MPSRLTGRISFSTLLLFSALVCGGAQPAALPLICSRLQLPADRIVDDVQTGDVTGDRVTDVVVLAGDRISPGSHYAGTHDLIIIDGKTGEQTTLSLGEESGGYAGSVLLGDFTGDGVDDILVALPTGGSGGISHYFLLSARDGIPAVLVNPQILSGGAHFRLSLENNYRLRVINCELGKQFTLNLRTVNSGDSPLTQLCRRVYSPSGKLLRHVNSDVDPLGVVELAPMRAHERAPLVGYQQLWVNDHANTVAIARSAWQLVSGKLLLSDIRLVSPAFPERYAEELQRLATLPPANAVPRAVMHYQTDFADQPPFFRDQAFMHFLDFHQAIVTRADGAFQRQNAEMQRHDVQLHHGDPSAQIARLAVGFNASPANKKAGLIAVYQGKGRWQIVPRDGFYQEQFGSNLTPDYREFLDLQNVEIHQPWMRDSSLVISLKALAHRLSAWEKYLVTYPLSPFAIAARDYYQAQLNAFLYGTDNTPHFPLQTGGLRPGVAEVMQYYVNTHPGTTSAAMVSRVLTLYTREHDRRTPTLTAALGQFRQEQDPAWVANYFPRTVGSSWIYPTGGTENTAYQQQVQYRQGTRVQVQVQSAMAHATRIYEVRENAILLVYQDENSTSTANRLNLHSNTVHVILHGPLIEKRTWSSDGMRAEIRTVNVPHVALCRLYPSTIEVVRTPVESSERADFEIHDFYAPGIGLVESRNEKAHAVTDTLLGIYTPGGF